MPKPKKRSLSLAATRETASSPSSLRIIAAASIGNALEWFDLLVYGYFAVTISRLFFPSSDQTDLQFPGGELSNPVLHSECAGTAPEPHPRESKGDR